MAGMGGGGKASNEERGYDRREPVQKGEGE